MQPKLLADPLPIGPVAHPVRASVRVPGSKSTTNRALLVAALAPGKTTLTNALFSDDSRYFAESLRRLGFTIDLAEAQASISVHGLGGQIPARAANLFVGNAGTAARFLTALLTLGKGEYVVDGEPRMRERPIGDLVHALTQLGANVVSLNPNSQPVESLPPSGVAICPPLRVVAAGLPGGTARVAGDVSSQFLSGLLLVAPYAHAPVRLIVERGLSSKPYVDLTLGVMSDFGVSVEREGYDSFSVRPQRYGPLPAYAIESDASAASYFFAAPAILGGSVRVAGISTKSRQGDIAFLDVLSRMGCTVSAGDGWVEVSGPARGTLRGVNADLRDIPDTAQTLAAIAPFAASVTTIRGIASARLKETDRIAAMCTELARLGVPVTELPDGLVIQPHAAVGPATVRTYNDHRMAMAFALIGLRVPGIAIENPGCVSKTFPDFFAVLDQLRGPDGGNPAEAG